MSNFRVFDKKANKYWHELENMVPQAIVLNSVGVPGLLTDNKDNQRVLFFNSDEVVVEKYSGMRDRKGNLVFEGDVVAPVGGGDNSFVLFSAGTFIVDDGGPLYEFTFGETPDILEDYIVVGNVWHNENLLKD